MLDRAFGVCRVLKVHPLAGGFRNANFKVLIDGHPNIVVVRIYEHDPSLCSKELDILRLVSSSVPVPAVIHGEPAALDGFPPFAVLQFVEGITLSDLKRSRDPDALAQAAHSAGEVLAAIGRFTFPQSGWLDAGLRVGDPLLSGSDPSPRFIDLCLASPNLQARVPLKWRERIHDYIWRWASRLAVLDRGPAQLVHCDFGGRNLVVRKTNGHWSIAAVLDWEFAVAGSPLIDIGHVLRYECQSAPRYEPHFSRGFLSGGGKLADDWRRLARVIDMMAGCEALCRDRLPDDVVAEWCELVRATVEERDPSL